MLPAVHIVLEALAVLLEAKGFAALAAPLVDPRGGLGRRGGRHPRRVRHKGRRRVVGRGRRLRVRVPRQTRGRRHRGRLELVLKGAGVPFEDGLAGLLDVRCVARGVVAVRAPALGAAGRREGKTLAVELEAPGLLAGARAVVGEDGGRVARPRVEMGERRTHTAADAAVVVVGWWVLRHRIGGMMHRRWRRRLVGIAPPVSPGTPPGHRREV